MAQQVAHPFGLMYIVLERFPTPCVQFNELFGVHLFLGEIGVDARLLRPLAGARPGGGQSNKLQLRRIARDLNDLHWTMLRTKHSY